MAAALLSGLFTFALFVLVFLNLQWDYTLFFWRKKEENGKYYISVDEYHVGGKDFDIYGDTLTFITTYNDGILHCEKIVSDFDGEKQDDIKLCEKLLATYQKFQ